MVISLGHFFHNNNIINDRERILININSCFILLATSLTTISAKNPVLQADLASSLLVGPAADKILIIVIIR